MAEPAKQPIPHPGDSRSWNDKNAFSWAVKIAQVLKSRFALVETLAAVEVVEVLTGMILLWPVPGDIPDGWLPRGTVVNRADYPDLFALIGTGFNTGGETGTQFRTPTVSAPPTGLEWIIKT